MRRDATPGVRIPPLLLIVLATSFGMVAAWQHVWEMEQYGPHRSVPLAHGMAMRMPFWLLWALFVPGMLWFARRWPLDRMRWFPGAALQLAVGAAVVLAHKALELGVQRILPQSLFVMGDPFPRRFGQFAADAITRDLGMYALLLGAVYCAAYYARYRERELAASQLQGQLARAQLQALRMQLNPHFLFNAMNSISMLVRGGRNAEAVRMLAGLGDLLRDVLEEDRPHEVPLRDELAFLERYLAIEQIRADRLQVRIDAEPEALDAQVPTLILQPIVENAIRHGISRSRAAGLLEIGARREGGTLVLSVRDDGPGIAATGRDGVGLANTRARLARMYGDEARLEITSPEGGGALVAIALPFHRRDAFADEAAA